MKYIITLKLGKKIIKNDEAINLYSTISAQETTQINNEANKEIY